MCCLHINTQLDILIPVSYFIILPRYQHTNMWARNTSIPFNPSKDIPSLAGKVILVTGGSSGLGRQSVLEFARHSPREIWLAARNVKKARQTVDEIQKEVLGVPIGVLELDLSSFESIKQAAALFKKESDRLDILMLNAGIMATSPGLTKEGYEMQFGTNHMGHVLLTKLLLPVLESTVEAGGNVRIVSLSSEGHASWRKGGFDFESLKTRAEELSALQRYFRSKLANVLWARQMAKEYPQFTVAAVHPGVVQTNLAEGSTGVPRIVVLMTRVLARFLKTVEDGAKNQLWASVADDVTSGEYFTPVGVTGNASADGMDDKLAQEVWDWTEKELGAYCS